LPDIDETEKETKFKKGYLNKYLATEIDKNQKNNIIDRLKELDNFSGVGTKA
jgi:heme oxygenase